MLGDRSDGCDYYFGYMRLLEWILEEMHVKVPPRKSGCCLCYQSPTQYFIGFRLGPRRLCLHGSHELRGPLKVFETNCMATLICTFTSVWFRNLKMQCGKHTPEHEAVGINCV